MQSIAREDAHGSNSLHGIYRDGKYVTSYFFVFFFVLFLRLGSAFFEVPVLDAGASLCFFAAAPVGAAPTRALLALA